MCKKLIYLVSFVLVLSLVRSASAELVGYWKFDEGSGTTAYDSSGNGLDGNLNGDPQWVEGQLGGALEFDGTDDYVSVPSSSSLQLTSALTIAGWIKADSWDSGNDVDPIARKGDGNPNNYQLAVVDGRATLYLDGGEADDDGFEGNTPLNTGQWYHVAATWDGLTVRIYVDGVIDNDPSDLHGDPIGTDTRPFYIGGRSGTDLLDGTLDDIRIYNRALTAEEVQWVMMGIPPGAAYKPSPADEATDVPREVVLSWKPGPYAAPINGHKFYLSENFNDVNDATGAAAQDANSYTPAQRLDFNKTYYWRVDEVNAPPTSHIEFKGVVWQFTTEPLANPIDGENITATASSSDMDQGPENTVNGSGLDVNDLHSTELTDMWLSDIAGPQPTWIQYEFDKICKLHQMWVWNHNTLTEPVIGYGVKEATIEYSADGANWTTLGTTHEFVRAPGVADYAHNTAVDLSGVAAKYVRLTISSNWGGILPQYGLSEVRFFSIPVFAREPSPDSEATDVDVDVTLGFRAGREAAEHNVYLSSDEQAVIDGNAPVTTVTEASYSTSLDIASTYYWRVDEVNEAETPTTWQGDIWSFSTPEFFIVDDFEDYNDYPPDEIFSTWIDGYYDSANGALVANTEPPFAETTIVHGGDQSMPFFYDNTGGATYSEGERTFAVPQDWTKAGVQTLTLWFYGTAGNTGQLYVKVNGSKVVYDGDASNLALAGWQLWNIDLTSSGLNLQSVSSLAIGIDGFGASGTLYFDDIGLYALAPAPPNEWRIDDDADDVEEAVATGIISRTSGDLELPYENTGQADPQIIGVRFTGIPIPKGATITEAWVRFQVDETKGGTEAVNLIIEGELSLDATGFTSDAFNVSSRPTTTAQVQWSVPNWATVGAQGPDQTTPSIASIIQEIVNQNGWASGTIVLMFRDNPANPSLGIRCAEAGPGGDAPLLHISYQ